MKKFVLVLVLLLSAGTVCFAADSVSNTDNTLIQVEIPSDSVEKVNIKYEKDKELTVTETLKNDSKDNSQSFAKETAKKTKSVAEKSVKETKSAAKKTAATTKSAAKKTADATKKAAKKTVNNTKDFIDSVNPNKEVTKESLQTSSKIKTLKNEKKEINSAYNSRIKDVNAKIKSTEKSTALSDVQKRNKIHKLNLEKQKLESEKAKYMDIYDTKIEKARNN